MKKFKVEASYITFYTLEVEAETEDEAYDLTMVTDFGDLVEVEELDKFTIDKITELKEQT